MLDSTQIHSGNYGVRGNLRLHGIFSSFAWSTTNLITLDGCFTRLYPKEKNFKGFKYAEDPLEDYCPNCFKKIVNVMCDEHAKKCFPLKILTCRDGKFNWLIHVSN